MDINIRKYCLLVLVLAGMSNVVNAQKASGNASLVYVDQQGSLRWVKGNQKAYFFGVNYTVPFAFGYRSHKKLGADLEKAIDNDVYHMARLGLDAFRVHVWDTEISDAQGNLINNEHLKLFDYLVAQLKKRNIYIIITPIAFWGNGYPERDEKTGSFSDKYGKEGALTQEEAFKAQENYLAQFYQHVNPYTRLAYKDDPNVIATEINNEPHHSGPQSLTTTYINRMIAAVKSTGWNKPVFYNISESPNYAGAVSASKADGFSFQWYPTGLVAGRTQKGNFLPNVDKYTYPYDTIPSFKNRARMVYEFDAGDVLQPVMYPAMASSFRAAGFQWATQFAYDPLTTANVNTEYQTHYLNLAYTPAKAISLMIAAKVFHDQEARTSMPAYQADGAFGAFKVSYHRQLSQMNTWDAFYYSNNTQDSPVKPSALKHIAGVGSSPVVTYSGNGAYFLDKLSNGLWRLEVMPDVIQVNDPFAKASPQKEVTRLVSQENEMQIRLIDLGERFNIKGLNQSNNFSSTANGQTVMIRPGTYLLSATGKRLAENISLPSGVMLNEFVAPDIKPAGVNLQHQPLSAVPAALPFMVNAQVTGLGRGDSVMLQINDLNGAYRMIKMQKGKGLNYTATLPADVVNPGLLQYRIMVFGADRIYHTFPGNHEGYPFAWDYAHDETWQSIVSPKDAPISLFNADKDRTQLNYYMPDWRKTRVKYTTSVTGDGLSVVLSNQSDAAQTLAFESFAEDKIFPFSQSVQSYNAIVVNASARNNTKIKVILADQDGYAFSSSISIDPQKSIYNIPLSSFIPDEMLLLPRPYPGFLPLWFKAPGKQALQLQYLSKIQVVAYLDNTSKEVAISAVTLQKTN